MALVAEFDIHCDALPLVGVAAAVPDATVLLELQFTHGERPLFLVTVSGAARGAVTAALDGAADVGEWTLIGRSGETRRYQVVPALSLDEQLGDRIDELDRLEALAAADAIVERIEVLRGGWRQTGWFADHEAFREFSSFWRENAGFSLHRLTEDGEPEPPGDGLTDEQAEALRTAFELGYFEVPRKATLTDVASKLGVSTSSLSERLRRAETQLIQETVGTTWPPLPDCGESD